MTKTWGQAEGGEPKTSGRAFVRICRKEKQQKWAGSMGMGGRQGKDHGCQGHQGR